MRFTPLLMSCVLPGPVGGAVTSPGPGSGRLGAGVQTRRCPAADSPSLSGEKPRQQDKSLACTLSAASPHRTWSRHKEGCWGVGGQKEHTGALGPGGKRERSLTGCFRADTGSTQGQRSSPARPNYRHRSPKCGVTIPTSPGSQNPKDVQSQD